MSEVILSVGIDVGTSTTSVVFSRLTLDNLAGAFSVPRIEITAKEIVYRSPVHETPLARPDAIDGEALRTLVLDEYARAGFTPSEVRTGAAIITGETARAENAEEVLAALSEVAGDFVVATAGPHLEAVLAARGAGVDAYSERVSDVVANVDVGGGTSNIAVYHFGKLLGTTCLDIGGRLVRVAGGRVTHVAAPVRRVAEHLGLTVAPGADADVDRLTALTRAMAHQLAMALSLAPRDSLHATLYTTGCEPLPAVLSPGVLCFSGGVADLIEAPRSADPFRYGDVGPLLGAAIAEDSAFRLVQRHRAAETIAATVVGAGIHTTEVSGATIEFAQSLLPLQNVPIIRAPDARSDPDSLSEEIETRCRTKDEYLTRPDLGAQFDDEAIAEVKQRCQPNPQVQVYVSDGLSSTAVEANVRDLLPALLQGLKLHGLTAGTPFFVKYGRVRSMEPISEALGAGVTCVLLGEHPGLATPESLSAYLAYQARVGMPESDRNCVSNIHREGTSPLEAGAHIADLIAEMFKQKTSGINLKMG